MKNQTITIWGELKDRLNILTKGFRILLLEKPKTKEDILFEIDEYQKNREEKYRYFEENNELRMERDNIIYKIEVMETVRTLFYPQPKLGTIAGTWIIEVTEIRK
ncbi:hypothetical protein NRK67_10065 [Fusobacteria bacterium ZRK30]|nr:hypothetical protein NRK67_10065 [Fusobacteria bacterium ZRK30]